MGDYVNKIINKQFLVFVSAILIMGILSGILYYYSLDQSIKDNVIITMNSFNVSGINNILRHVVILSIITVSSMLIIGFPLSLFYLYYEGIGIGFTLTVFTILSGMKGLLYSIIYIIFTKALFIFLLFISIKKILNISKLIVNYMVNKNSEKIKSNLIYNFKNLIYVILLIILNDIIIYFFSDNVLNLFAFLIN